MHGTTKASRVVAIVLAAGMSRRMGQLKQVLRWREKTLVEHALDNVRCSRVNDILLVLGAGAEEVRSQIASDDLKVVVNPEYRQGMGTSLRSGVAALDSDVKAAFVVLADQPFVRPATLDRMISCYETCSPQALIPLYRGFRGNPVLIDRSLFPELLTLAGDVGCRGVLGRHTRGIQKIEVDDPGILLDIDTADDWTRLTSSTSPLEHFSAYKDVEGERHAGAPEIVIVGKDAVARGLAGFGRVLGFAITVVDPLMSLQDFPQADRLLHRLDLSALKYEECYIVIASRGQFDEDVLEEALRIRPRYIGLLANRHRAEEIFQGLKEKGVPEEEFFSVHAPIGMAIGAETPQELALSIMAEIIAVRRKTPARKD